MRTTRVGYSTIRRPMTGAIPLNRLRGFPRRIPAIKYSIVSRDRVFGSSRGKFLGVSTLLKGFHVDKLNKGRIAALAIEALTQRRNSPASTRNVVKIAIALVQFFLDTRADPNPSGSSLTGECSAALLRDYLESVADRGRNVPGDVKSPLITRPEDLGVACPLDNPPRLCRCAVRIERYPMHAPPMKPDTVRKLELLAPNVEIDPFKRAFSAGILLMKYASLRFSDVQRFRSPEVNGDSARVALLQLKTKKPHGAPRPWACPRVGVSGPT